MRVRAFIVCEHAVVSPDITPTGPDLADLLPSWQRHLRAERKSPETVDSYGTGVRQFLAWAERTGEPAALTRRVVNAFVADLLEGGVEAATARSRQLAVRRFSAWLAEEGEIGRDDLVGLRAPKLDTKVVDALTDDQLAALIKACAGKEIRERRDHAIVRFMAETGARAGEVVAMTVSGTDLNRGLATIVRGKGGKGRVVPFGPKTTAAIDSYLRARRTHILAGTDALWLGSRQGRGFTYDALHKTLADRAAQAGIEGFHPHKLRHTAATRWLAAGGSEGGLMAVAGWARRDMIDRYTRATASERAAEESRRLGLGDI